MKKHLPVTLFPKLSRQQRTINYIICILLAPVCTIAVYYISFFILGFVFCIIGALSWAMDLGWWGALEESLDPLSYITSGVFLIGYFTLSYIVPNEGVDRRGTHELAIVQALKEHSFTVKDTFTIEKKFTSGRTVMVNDKLDRLLVVTGINPYEDLLIKPENIVEISLVLDEDIISVTSSGTGGSLVGAAFGGLLTGGAGAVVGAIAGGSQSTSTSTGLRRIAINVILNLPELPLLTLTFHSSEFALKKGGWLLKGVVEKAENWVALLKVVASRC